MHVVNHPEAEAKLEVAAIWHEERQPQNGNDFFGEFECTASPPVLLDDRC